MIGITSNNCGSATIARYIICVCALGLSGCSNACEDAFDKWNTNESTAAILLSTGKEDDKSVAQDSARFAAEGKKEAEDVCSADEYADRLLTRELETLPETRRVLEIREIVKQSQRSN